MAGAELRGARFPTMTGRETTATRRELTIAFKKDSDQRPKDFEGEGARVTVLKLFRKKDK